MNKLILTKTSKSQMHALCIHYNSFIMNTVLLKFKQKNNQIHLLIVKELAHIPLQS
ncbi:hypothetical protein KORDIASMS9_01124 [Kordia sp. SMS9]|nr:hypothetical protein KORDIASMS9_01124 [Kordia sp. SMS9]